MSKKQIMSSASNHLVVMLGSHSTSLDENMMNEFNETAIVDNAVNANPRVDSLNSSAANKSHSDGYGIIRT